MVGQSSLARAAALAAASPFCLESAWGGEGFFFGGGGGDNKVEASSERREGQEMDSVQGERK